MGRMRYRGRRYQAGEARQNFNVTNLYSRATAKSSVSSYRNIISSSLIMQQGKSNKAKQFERAYHGLGSDGSSMHPSGSNFPVSDSSQYQQQYIHYVNPSGSLQTSPNSPNIGVYTPLQSYPGHNSGTQYPYSPGISVATGQVLVVPSNAPVAWSSTSGSRRSNDYHASDHLGSHPQTMAVQSAPSPYHNSLELAHQVSTRTLSRQQDWTQIHIPAHEGHSPIQPLSAFAPDSSYSAGPLENFIGGSFPPGTYNWELRRQCLLEIMTSPWKQRNELEPSGELLLRLMDKIDNVWHCGFYESGVKCSSCSATRRIQAIEHVRRHIDLLPFACEGGPCPVSHDGCHKRYSSPDPLKKHREGSRNGQSVCHLCHKAMLPGNIKRHQENNCHAAPRH